jgi:hypothetical protein
MPERLIDAYGAPPQSPDECVFAKTTTCLSSDFEMPISPCQFGGRPDCADCGCIAAAGLTVVGRHRLFGGVSVGAIYDASARIGVGVKRVRDAFVGTRRQPIPAMTANASISLPP